MSLAMQQSAWATEQNIFSTDHQDGMCTHLGEDNNMLSMDGTICNPELLRKRGWSIDNYLISCLSNNNQSDYFKCYDKRQ